MHPNCGLHPSLPHLADKTEDRGLAVVFDFLVADEGSRVKAGKGKEANVFLCRQQGSGPGAFLDRLAAVGVSDLVDELPADAFAILRTRQEIT